MINLIDEIHKFNLFVRKIFCISFILNKDMGNMRA
jgi:hypothetical protein